MGGGGDLSWTRRGGQSLSTLPRVRRVFCGPGLGLLGSEGGLNEGQVRKRWVTELPRLQGPDQGGEQDRVERASPGWAWVCSGGGRRGTWKLPVVPQGDRR